MEYQPDDDKYFSINTPRPAVNQTFNEYVCASFGLETKCSLIYLGYKINGDEINNKVVFKFSKRVKGKEYRLDNEIQIMNFFNNPYILKPLLAFDYRQYLCIITKFAPHGTLNNIIPRHRKGIGEDLARIAMRQMLEGIKCLHSNRVMHRDIKPENFLVYSWYPDPIYVVLADFGFSKFFEKDELGKEYIGTYDYAAPEIYYNRPYTNSVDIWSLGITLFYMLTGQNPFPRYEIARKECIKQIMEGRLNMNILQNNGNSLEAINLIENMCQYNPSDRCTAEMALQHQWFSVPEKYTVIESQTRDYMYKNDIAET